MSTRFALGCHHLGHDNIYEWTRDDGTPLRPWARNSEEGDEALIDAHNKVVGKKDTTYFMAMSRSRGASSSSCPA